MPRKVKPLTALAVRTLPAGRHADGGGLFLLVGKPPSARKSWLFRYVRAGRMREMGLGAAAGAYAVSLADARGKAAALRARITAGGDPLAERDAARLEAESKAVTFRAAADLFIAENRAGWRNAKHAAQWDATLRTYADPVLGDLPVGEVETGHVLAVLSPLWTRLPETAGRLRGRIERVLDFARVKGWRDGENVARWGGHLKLTLPARKKVRAVKAHAALPWSETPAFMAELRARSGMSARALEFAILCAARSNEVLGATWQEIDLAAGTWSVPGSRMKAGRPHTVPLPGAALAILADLALLRPAGDDGSAPVFPAKSGRTLSGMALLMLLRRMRRNDLTAHGFRATFRTWGGDATAFPRELLEMALAHRVGDGSELAYSRGDALAKRRVLMTAWGRFCLGEAATGEVVPFRPAS